MFAEDVRSIYKRLRRQFEEVEYEFNSSFHEEEEFEDIDRSMNNMFEESKSIRNQNLEDPFNINEYLESQNIPYGSIDDQIEVRNNSRRRVEGSSFSDNDQVSNYDIDDESQGLHRMRFSVEHRSVRSAARNSMSQLNNQ